MQVACQFRHEMHSASRIPAKAMRVMALLLLVALAAWPVQAQDYPTRIVM